MLKLWRRKTVKAPGREPGKAVVLSLKNSGRGLDFLVDLVKKIRPANPRKTEEAETKFKALLFQLQDDRTMLFALRKSLLSQFLHSNLLNALTESGITSGRGFVQELTGKLKHKFLPPLQQPGDVLYVISRVFYVKTDYLWVQSIDNDLWIKFFELLGIQINVSDPTIISQLNEALQALSYRITTLGLEKEIINQSPGSKEAIDPFLEQNRLVNIYLEKYKHLLPEERRLLLSNITENLNNCYQSLEWLREQRRLHGTSLAQTFLTVRLTQQLERALIIVDILDTDNTFNTERFIEYFFTVIRNENRKNSLKEFLSQNLGMLAYQIAEHKGRKGEKYISTTRRDFGLLFNSAMKGGVIVSFVAIFKNLLGLLHLPIFWQGAAYGTNYALGFVLMDETNSTLATKQPAYTASAVASSLDREKLQNKPDLKNLAITVARTSRSQIASFAGNLVIVFPLTYFLAMLYDISFHQKIAGGEAAAKLLADQHPWQSLSLLYACFTGFFLFLSGIIAGYVENHVVYGRISERLKTHPIFRNTMSQKRLDRLVRIVDTSSGALAGSIALGFFLGCAGPLGKFLGIPFDIRHITISAGNTGIGFYGMEHNVSLGYMLTIVGGVLMIGFLNFLVSFSLAFYVAVKSRGIKLSEYNEFFGILGRYVRKHPKDFLFPPKRIRTSEDLR